MIWVGILFAILIAVLVTALFSLVFRRAPWGSYWLLFFIIFLATLAAGIWVEPIGAPVYGFYWLPGAIVALVFALLIAATLPSGSDRAEERRKMGFRENDPYPPKPGLNPRDEDPHRDYSFRNSNRMVQPIVSGIFWVLLIFLMFIVMIGYFV